MKELAINEFCLVAGGGFCTCILPPGSFTQTAPNTEGNESLEKCRRTCCAPTPALKMFYGDKMAGYSYSSGFMGQAQTGRC